MNISDPVADSVGCHLISTAAAAVLTKHKVQAKAILVAAWSPRSECWIPHWVVQLRDGFILDFKRRIFGEMDWSTGKNVPIGIPDQAPEVHENGYYPCKKKSGSPILIQAEPDRHHVHQYQVPEKLHRLRRRGSWRPGRPLWRFVQLSPEMCCGFLILLMD